MFTRRNALGAGATLATIRPGRAQTSPVLRIGILGDQSGVYRDQGGAGSQACVRQAVAEYASQNGLTVEVVAADHQNRPDVGLALARQWFDQGVDVVTDIQGSAIALAINSLVRERDKVMLPCNVGISDITGRACSPNTVHWAYDTQMLTRVAAAAMLRQGGDSWFVIRADYAFGRTLFDEVSAMVTKGGGRVVGSVATPFPNTDFSSAILQAQASRAKVVALALSGDDMVNAVKQAAEFGLTRRGQKLAALLTFINNIDALGLPAAQGLGVASSFYWDLNDRTRAFSRRVLQSGFNPNLRPNMSQAGTYSAVTHYMKAVKSLGVAEAKRSGRAVVERMKAMPVEDDVLGQATIRADGRVVSNAYLFEVKSPAESSGQWDYYKLLATVSPEDAWRPLNEGGCPMITG
ncbi:ABC transporter substrate-binding protein [Roseococcus sp. SYP-B2431]|uniref:ABC transporter substrate-binding protein n=1 Tax=Roseococcus sp. SYP-B2431 TaxID=2496640 RepID=UPI00103DA4B5|nr:ABC transporter substrate-binding protein [Roseococcus sp. SYP-B2431]TCH97098.1 ABC transporter substrate-binding protein [Roseococcus sp. SYP-B2431]